MYVGVRERECSRKWRGRHDFLSFGKAGSADDVWERELSLSILSPNLISIQKWEVSSAVIILGKSRNLDKNHQGQEGNGREERRGGPEPTLGGRKWRRRRK